MAKDILPNLESLLQYSDQKIVEQACLCFVRLADSYKSNAAHLQARLEHNVKALEGGFFLHSQRKRNNINTRVDFSCVFFAL